MQFSFFGFKISLERKNKLQNNASIAKKNIVLKKLDFAIKRMVLRDIKYSEYKLQKITKLSINTIKKYRPEIKDILDKYYEYKEDEYLGKLGPDIDWDKIFREKRSIKLMEKKQEEQLSRKENIKKVNKERIAKTKQKINNLLYSKEAKEFKKPSGDWHISKIAKHLNLNRNTVAKYIKDI